MITVDLPQDVLKCYKITWTMDNNDNFVASPWTGAGQSQRGARKRWKAVIEFRPMTAAEFESVEAFMLALEGSANKFRMYPYDRPTPRGIATGSPKIKGTVTTGSTSITTEGWTASTTDILKAGDWLGISQQLYKVRETLNSNGSGEATVKIWPPLQATETNTVIVISKPRGTFRYTEGPLSFEVDWRGRPQTHSFSISAIQDVLLGSTPSSLILLPAYAIPGYELTSTISGQWLLNGNIMSGETSMVLIVPYFVSKDDVITQVGATNSVVVEAEYVMTSGNDLVTLNDGTPVTLH